jgi:hypothetical protein
MACVETGRWNRPQSPSRALLLTAPALCASPFRSGDASQAFDREQVPHRVVTVGEPSKVCIDSDEVTLDGFAGPGARPDAAHASWPSSKDASGA